MEEIRDLYEQHASDLASLTNRQKERKLSELNVHRQLLNLSNLDVVQRAWDNDRNLILLGWYFDIHKGEIQEIFSMQSRDILTQVAARG
jgi:carbonic anhydrase